PAPCRRGEQLKCHAAPWENRARRMEIHSFSDFWPYYVRAHSRGRTRVLHAVGSVLAVVMLGVALAVNLWFLVAAPVIGYAFAWYAHFFVEGNKPATFG